MFTADAEQNWSDFGYLGAYHEAVAMDRAYGAGAWIAMVKHYEEEERYAVYAEGDHADRRLCPSCRAQWEKAPDFLTTPQGFMLIHAQDCEYLPWLNALDD